MSTVLNAKQIKAQLIQGFTPAASAAFIIFSLNAAKVAIDKLKMALWDSTPLDVEAADLIYLVLLRLMSIQDQSVKLVDANIDYFTKLKVLPAMNDNYQRLLNFQCYGRKVDNLVWENTGLAKYVSL
ncbi:hypothetical protein HDU89_000716 [Geranomyces variabilis]|nr:hypothetical protein HDU89_000716 [Geranomyces variabilis]